MEYFTETDLSTSICRRIIKNSPDNDDGTFGLSVVEEVREKLIKYYDQKDNVPVLLQKLKSAVGVDGYTPTNDRDAVAKQLFNLLSQDEKIKKVTQKVRIQEKLHEGTNSGRSDIEVTTNQGKVIRIDGKTAAISNSSWNIRNIEHGSSLFLIGWKRGKAVNEKTSFVDLMNSIHSIVLVDGHEISLGINPDNNVRVHPTNIGMTDETTTVVGKRLKKGSKTEKVNDGFRMLKCVYISRGDSLFESTEEQKAFIKHIRDWIIGFNEQ